MCAACKGSKTFSEKLTACSGREVITVNRKYSVDSKDLEENQLMVAVVS